MNQGATVVDMKSLCEIGRFKDAFARCRDL